VALAGVMDTITFDGLVDGPAEPPQLDSATTATPRIARQSRRNSFCPQRYIERVCVAGLKRFRALKISMCVSPRARGVPKRSSSWKTHLQTGNWTRGHTKASGNLWLENLLRGNRRPQCWRLDFRDAAIDELFGLTSRFHIGTHAVPDWDRPHAGRGPGRSRRDDR
jgi:hypothetical protein